MKKYIIIFLGLLLLPMYSLYSQTITGPNEVEESTTAKYKYVDGVTGATYSWDYTGDYSVISENSDSLEIQWSSAGVNLIQLYSSGTYLEDELSVIVGNPFSIEYTYDASGNRITREVVTLGPPPGGTKSLPNEAEILDEIEEQEFNQFKVYPNPATQSVFVSLNDAALKAPNRRILVFDYLGKQLLSVEAFDEVTQVDLSSFKSGIYILKLIYGNSSKECKIIKQ